MRCRPDLTLACEQLRERMEQYRCVASISGCAIIPASRCLLRISYDRKALGTYRSVLFMNIVDLRQTTVRQIEPLLEEESRHWRDELHWDYRGALELIKRFMEARALAGCVAFESGTAAGYS